MKLAYGNYGMPDIHYEPMIQLVADIGYDGVEICVRDEYSTAPANLTSFDRRQMRRLAQDHGLDLTWLMAGSFGIVETVAAQHRENLDALRRVFELGHELELEPPIVVSTDGGRVADWDSLRSALVDQLADWVMVAEEFDGIVAVEPHAGALLNTPDRTLWLLEQIPHPRLKINFDYSHFEVIDVPMEEAISLLIEHASGIHVKDVRGRGPEFRYILPGEGDVNYAEYLKLVATAGYDGFITTEISAHVFRADGYDPVAAAKYCYKTLADAFDTADIGRN